MNKRTSLSGLEWDSIESLGGLEECKAATDRILRDYGIAKSLFSEHAVRALKLDRRRQTEGVGIIFQYYPERSLRANITDLLDQALELQRNSGGTAYVGAMLQHLVGAKLDLVLGKGQVKHHGFSVADQSTERKGDFQADDVCLHVTTIPSEALIRKCANNLREGLKPLIITLSEAVSGANSLLRIANLQDRVDVLDATQFLTANVYEHSLFKATNRKLTLSKLLTCYNEIVVECETDPSLKINLGKTE